LTILTQELFYAAACPKEEVAIETAVFPRAEVTKDYPDVTTGRELADAITTRMVLKPKTLDILNPLIVS